jgi:hypothetical protein
VPPFSTAGRRLAGTLQVQLLQHAVEQTRAAPPHEAVVDFIHRALPPLGTSRHRRLDKTELFACKSGESSDHADLKQLHA